MIFGYYILCIIWLLNSQVHFKDTSTWKTYNFGSYGWFFRGIQDLLLCYFSIYLPWKCLFVKPCVLQKSWILEYILVKLGRLVDHWHSWREYRNIVICLYMHPSSSRSRKLCTILNFWTPEYIMMIFGSPLDWVKKVLEIFWKLVFVIFRIISLDINIWSLNPVRFITPELLDIILMKSHKETAALVNF